MFLQKAFLTTAVLLQQALLQEALVQRRLGSSGAVLDEDVALPAQAWQKMQGA